MSAVGGEEGSVREETGRPAPSSLAPVARLLLKLGFVAFGGPAAHIAMLEDEVVVRRRWLTRQRFLDMVGATNLIPGPNSTEMAMHVGYSRAGLRGLVIGGVCFIGPAVVITAAFAWAYLRYGSLPSVSPFLAGIKPAVLAVILSAVWRLGRTAVRGVRLAAVGVAVLLAVLVAGVNEVVALLAGAAGGAALLLAGPRPGDGSSGPRAAGGLLGAVTAHGHQADGAGWAEGAGRLTLGFGGGALGTGAGALGSISATVPLWKLGLFFLKVGAVLYGSGYVLVAFLEGDLVEGYGWLTHAELLDAIAIGQFTPGPVLSTATFIGYILAGPPGAAVATAAIFFPSFLFVWVLAPVIPRLRDSRWTAAFLDAVNVSAVGLMAAVTIALGTTVLTDWRGGLIAVAAAVLAIRFRVGSAWLVLGGGALGWALRIGVG